MSRVQDIRQGHRARRRVELLSRSGGSVESRTKEDEEDEAVNGDK